MESVFLDNAKAYVTTADKFKNKLRICQSKQEYNEQLGELYHKAAVQFNMAQHWNEAASYFNAA